MRLNIYVPDDLATDVRSFRKVINLSQVCSAALRDAIIAYKSQRYGGPVLLRLAHHHSEREARVAHRYSLRHVIAAKPKHENEDPTETVAHGAADFFYRALGNEMQLAVAGGTQMWSVVRAIERRALRLEVSAVGFGHVDPALPHLHANALVTFLSLLYSPRSTPLLAGSPAFAPSWSLEAPSGDQLRRVVIGSCAPFSAKSSYAALLGKEITDYLVEEKVIGEFLGVFFTADGRMLEPYPPGATVSHFAASDLRDHAKRSDTLVILAAAGAVKVDVMRRVLEESLCNMLITDETTASALLGRARGEQ